MLIAAAANAEAPAAGASASPAADPSPIKKPAGADTSVAGQADDDDDSHHHPAPNSIFAEGLGAGLAYSINYERLVLDELAVRVGFSYLSVGASATDSSGSTTTASATFVSFPITASYLGIRSGKHALELGGGTTLTYTSASAGTLGVSSASGSGLTPFGVLMVGYRLHPVDHAGFQFRIGAMALAAKGLGFSSTNPDSFGVLPWAYMSMGASF
jgi:hypothetical protein